MFVNKWDFYDLSWSPRSQRKQLIWICNFRSRSWNAFWREMSSDLVQIYISKQNCLPKLIVLQYRCAMACKKLSWPAEFLLYNILSSSRFAVQNYLYTHTPWVNQLFYNINVFWPARSSLGNILYYKVYRSRDLSFKVFETVVIVNYCSINLS